MTNQTRWLPSASYRIRMSQPRMRKFATVLPTRIVHKKFSGFSKKSCSTLAERRPARICWRTRNRLSAKTPASMPESRKESARQKLKSSQISELAPMWNEARIKIPNPKLQIPNKLQIPTPKLVSGWGGVLELRIWDLELYWDLRFGIWSFGIDVSFQRLDEQLAHTAFIGCLSR